MPHLRLLPCQNVSVISHPPPRIPVQSSTTALALGQSRYPDESFGPKPKTLQNQKPPRDLQGRRRLVERFSQRCCLDIAMAVTQPIAGRRNGSPLRIHLFRSRSMPYRGCTSHTRYIFVTATPHRDGAHNLETMAFWGSRQELVDLFVEMS